MRSSASATRASRGWFDRAAHRVSIAAGHAWVFLCALGAVLMWAALGPIFDFGDGWQLVINTSTTIVTFLMVFLIQNTQNRDALALHAKLDALIAKSDASNELTEIEERTEDEIRATRESAVGA